MEQWHAVQNVTLCGTTNFGGIVPFVGLPIFGGIIIIIIPLFIDGNNDFQRAIKPFVGPILPPNIHSVTIIVKNVILVIFFVKIENICFKGPFWLKNNRLEIITL